MIDRKLKFRAWDKHKGEYNQGVAGIWGLSLWGMLDYQKFCEEAYPEHGKMTERFIIEQFTGLLDKHDKEIYEGDIVEVSHDETFKVEWYEKTASWILSGSQTGKVRWIENRERFAGYEFKLSTNDCEIIGNIHEDKNERD